ncbi:hypothetical protein MPSI1_003146 [Malassezia psittaci]|uniref:Fatty acid hydroxylase domain-containing protein n=1 Tax=Malassezia psittaci TaxID=1821823 RepID=A0AAF0F872_9BASI|nr:hypothetical protein MPSI1_003146 [Malassezia psittaci]
MATKRDTRPRPFADDWKHRKWSELNLSQRAVMKMDFLNRSSKDYTYPKPKGKVPRMTAWDQCMHLLPTVMLPLSARWLFMQVTGWTIHPIIAYVTMVLVNVFAMTTYNHRHRAYVEKYGFLDGDVDRDALPESMTGKLLKEMMMAMLGRPLVIMLMTYDRTELPSLSWWLPLQLTVFTIIADFVYYWAHRATHEVPWLWKFHRLHHTTKHPSSYLLGFADEPQEIFDIFITPILTYLVYPLNYDTLFIWLVYYMTLEMGGHCGVRAYYPGVLVGISGTD